MRKLLLLLLLPLFAQAQIPEAKDTTLITPSSAVTPQFRYSTYSQGGVNYRIPQVYNPSLGKYDSYITSKYLRAFYMPLSAISGYVPTSRTLTINGVGYDLSANRSWTVGVGDSAILNNQTSTPENKRIYLSQSIRTDSALYGGYLRLTTNMIPSSPTPTGQDMILGRLGTANYLAWKGANNRLAAFNSNPLTGNRTYDLPDNSGRILLDIDTSGANGYVRNWKLVNGLAEKIAPVATISDLQALTTTGTVIVTDTLRGGIFTYMTGSFTTDGGTIFAATGVGSGYWIRNYKINQPIPITWFGDIVNGGDNRAVIQNAINVVSALHGTLYFPYIGYDYTYSSFLQVLTSDFTIDAAPGVWLNNTLASAGYVRDGIRVGNSDSTNVDGGTNVYPYTYTTGVTIKNINFRNVRIGVWFVRSKNCGTENISADGVSAIAAGNDASDDCFNMTFKNTTMKGWTLNLEAAPFYIIGLFRVDGFIIDGLFQDVEMPAASGGPSNLEISNSSNGTFTNIHVGSKNTSAYFASGITVVNSRNIVGTNWTIENCYFGFTSFGTSVIYQNSQFTNGTITKANQGLRVLGVYNTYSNITTDSCTVDVQVGGDAFKNSFSDNYFNPGDTANIQEALVGGLALQHWDNNEAIGYEYLNYFNDNKIANATYTGFLSNTDWSLFNSKQAAIPFGSGVLSNLGINLGDAGSLLNYTLGDARYLKLTGGTISDNLNISFSGTATKGYKIQTTGTDVSMFDYNSATGENRVGGVQSYVYPVIYSGGVPSLSFTTAGKGKFEFNLGAVLPSYSTGTRSLSVYNSTNDRFETTTELPNGTTASTPSGSTDVANKAYVDGKASASNFVDLTTTQTVAGAKTFSNLLTGNEGFFAPTGYGFTGDYASISMNGTGNVGAFQNTSSTGDGIFAAAGSTKASTHSALDVRSYTNSVIAKHYSDVVEYNVPVQLKNYTVATLPTGTTGMTAYVTDALAPSYLVAVVGGGSIVTPVFYNGTNWIAH